MWFDAWLKVLHIMHGGYFATIDNDAIQLK